MTAHWGIPDPAAAQGSEAEIALAFKDAYRMLHRRIGIFTALPIGKSRSPQPASKLKEIGRLEDATAKAESAELMPSLAQRAFAEFLGTAFLLAAVVGSGIMAQKLAGGNGALALLCNTLRDRCDSGGADPGFRPAVRRAFQSRRQSRLRAAR